MPEAAADAGSARIRFARAMARRDPALRLYALLDADTCARHGTVLLDVALAWRDAGIKLVQYRDKTASRATVLETAQSLRAIFPAGEYLLLLNDDPRLALEAGLDGAHVGQGDMPAQEARRVLGPDHILGISTHTPDEALAAGALDVDYLAIGPVFATTTKADASTPVGLCGVQAAKAVARKPLVAIGGIAPAQCRPVLQAGADSVALISALFPVDKRPGAFTQQAQDILAALK